MKQILQDIANGTTYTVEAPAPAACLGNLLIGAAAGSLFVFKGKYRAVLKLSQSGEKGRVAGRSG